MFTKGFQFAEPVKLAHDGRSVGTGGSGLTLWSLWCVEPLAPESQAAAAVAEKSNDDDEDDDSDDDDDNDAKDNNDDFELQDEADEADEAADVARALHRRVSLAILEQVHKRLRQKRREYGRFRYVDRARVPIISRLHGPARSPLGVFKFDLTCDRLLGVYNSELLGAYSALDTRFVALAKVAKKWAEIGRAHV